MRVSPSRALTATEDGCVICWEASRDACQQLGEVVERTATKAIRLHLSPINVMTTCGSKIVTGGDDGNVRFFDEDLRIEHWFEVIRAQNRLLVVFEPTALSSRFRPLEVDHKYSVAGVKCRGHSQHQFCAKPGAIRGVHSSKLLRCYCGSTDSLCRRIPYRGRGWSIRHVHRLCNARIPVPYYFHGGSSFKTSFCSSLFR